MCFFVITPPNPPCADTWNRPLTSFLLRSLSCFCRLAAGFHLDNVGDAGGIRAGREAASGIKVLGSTTGFYLYFPYKTFDLCRVSGPFWSHRRSSQFEWRGETSCLWLLSASDPQSKHTTWQRFSHAGSILPAQNPQALTLRSSSSSLLLQTFFQWLLTEKNEEDEVVGGDKSRRGTLIKGFPHFFRQATAVL